MTRQEQRRTIESIHIIAQILGPARSLDDTLEILKHVTHQKGQMLRVDSHWRVS